MRLGSTMRLMLIVSLLICTECAIAQGHALQGTYIDDTRAVSTTIPAGSLVPIGNAIRVTCSTTLKTGCTVVADMWATNGAGNTSANQFELCLVVDGVRADPYCYGYQGLTPADGTWVMATSSQSLSGLAAGTHMVQAYFWSANGCTVIGRHFNYMIYTP
jgi:hypothetical protein